MIYQFIEYSESTNDKLRDIYVFESDDFLYELRVKSARNAYFILRTDSTNGDVIMHQVDPETREYYTHFMRQSEFDISTDNELVLSEGGYEVLDKNGNIVYKIQIDDSIALKHPMHNLFPDMLGFPISIIKPGKLRTVLTEQIISTSKIEEIFNYFNLEDYKIIADEELKVRVKLATGHSYDELMLMLNEKQSDADNE